MPSASRLDRDWVVGCHLLAAGGSRCVEEDRQAGTETVHGDVVPERNVLQYDGAEIVSPRAPTASMQRERSPWRDVLNTLGSPHSLSKPSPHRFEEAPASSLPTTRTVADVRQGDIAVLQFSPLGALSRPENATTRRLDRSWVGGSSLVSPSTRGTPEPLARCDRPTKPERSPPCW